MLPGGLSLRRLPQDLSLTLLLLHLLTYSFTLGLLHVRAFGTLLVDLLPTKILHLLPGVSITARCLSGQISHLSLARLLCGEVWLLTGLCAISNTFLARTLICNLKFLVSYSVGQRLNA